MSRPVVLTALALLAGACVPSEEDGVQLLVPADLEFSWNDAYDAPDDGLAAVLPLDVMVYDAVTGEALAGVEVTLSSDVVSFVEAEAILRADLDCDDCVWDAWRDAYVELDHEAVTTPLVVTTDASGLARAHAVVDAIDGEPVEVQVELGRRVETLNLLPR